MLTLLMRLLTPFTRLASWLYARPEDVLLARFEQLLDKATFVGTSRPSACNLLLALHAAGLNAEGLQRAATLRMVLLTPENETAAQQALAAGNLTQLPANTQTFDLNADYFHVLLVRHARGSFAGLYYLPTEFNGNVSKLNTVWLHPWPQALPLVEKDVTLHYMA
ncbi:hypothetical protein GCM10022409_29020 [Hymenobacter glaciei]|uniref:Uncharacterized protein n=1 Tax=Hymenobacter glaciei TaxID=877209 RepID=A0ABP7UDR6_9BACT